MDLAQRRPVALLHDREADALASWWRKHPGVTIIARDRLKAYIDGARAGAPEALQVTDRFHLLQNLAEALDQGWSNRAIAQPLGIGRMTVVRYLQAPTFPERKGRSDTGKCLLTPYKEGGCARTTRP